MQERIAQSRPAGEEGKGGKEDAGSEERGMTAVVKGSHLSLVDASHTTCVTDLQWLPGMSFTRDGRPPTATRVGSPFLLSPCQTAHAAVCTEVMAHIGPPAAAINTVSTIRHVPQCTVGLCRTRSRPCLPSRWWKR